MRRSRQVFEAKKTKLLAKFGKMGRGAVNKLQDVLKRNCAHSGDPIRPSDKVAFIITDTGELAPVKFRALKRASLRRGLLEKSEIEKWLRERTRNQASSANKRLIRRQLPQYTLTHG